MREPKKIVRHNGFIRLIKFFIRIIKKKPKLIHLEEDLPDRALYIANHNGAAGPMTLITFYPKILVPWGTYQMTKGYLSRWKYLYHVFYIQKLGYSKVRSFILATLFGLVSRILYDGVRLIPSYPDVRMRQTIDLSIKHLECGNSILIFPEDSSAGYQDEMESFHKGFIYLAEAYEKKHNEQLAIVPVYFHKEKNSIITGKVHFIDTNKSRHDLSEDFRACVNDLSHQ